MPGAHPFFPAPNPIECALLRHPGTETLGRPCKTAGFKGPSARAPRPTTGEPLNATMNTARDGSAPSSDDNALIAERREKLAAIRAQRRRLPERLQAEATAPPSCARKHGDLANEELEPQAIAGRVAGRLMLKRIMGKASFAHAAGRDRPDPALRHQRRARRGRLRRVQALRPRRHRRRRGHAVQDADRRAVGAGVERCAC